MSDLIWKPICAGLVLIILVGGGLTGANWWLAARDRDKAVTELTVERKASEDLRTTIREQNRAVEAMAAAKAMAEQKGAAARQLADANAKRFDLVLRQIGGAKATTCDEAMPAVDAVLEAIK